MIDQRPSVLLTTEGTYPFHRGGVSTWCDVLSRELSDYDFTVCAVTMHPYLRRQYALARNVRLIQIPLWGTEDPIEYAARFSLSRCLQARWNTTEDVVASRFVPTFDRFLALVLGDELHLDCAALGALLLEMHLFFVGFDYQRTATSQAVWQCFRQRMTTQWSTRPADSRATMLSVTEALRLLFRFLQVLQHPVPVTTLSHSTAAAFCGLPCIIAKLQRGTPFLLTEHGVYLREQYLNLRRYIPCPVVRGFLQRLCAAMARANYHFADQISPVCAYNVRWERWWGADLARVSVIHNGADPAVFRPRDPAPPGRPVVVCMGLFFALKGQRQLIDAAKLVKEERHDVIFKLFGNVSDAAYFAECQHAVRTFGLEETVIFAGATTAPADAYNEATIVVSPSLSEGQPYALIEAMLCGRPIIATEVGGVPETIGDVGVLVPVNRPEVLAGEILRLLQSPHERSRLGKAARARALEHFTQQVFVQAYRSSYERLRASDARGVVTAKDSASTHRAVAL